MKKRNYSRLLLCVILCLLMLMITACSGVGNVSKFEDNREISTGNKIENAAPDTDTETQEAEREPEPGEEIEKTESIQKIETKEDPEGFAVEIPDFSAKGGFYDNEFTLTLSAPHLSTLSKSSRVFMPPPTVRGMNIS